MELQFMSNGSLRIDDARIIYKNFSGAKTLYNSEGKRNFAIIIDTQEIADMLDARGWNVHVKPPREEGDLPFMYLKVNVGKVRNEVNDRGVWINVKTPTSIRRLTEDTVGELDNIMIESASLDIRPNFYDIGGRSGLSGWVSGMTVVQHIDRFMEEFMNSNTIGATVEEDEEAY